MPEKTIKKKSATGRQAKAKNSSKKTSAKRTTRTATTTAAAKNKKSTRKKPSQKKVRRTPRTYKPEDMSLEDWQISLRREFGQQQDFKLKSLDEHKFFSLFSVTNPDSGGVYDIIIRGNQTGDNHCTCPDFAINTLGTCKHIEFALAKIAHQKGGKKTLEEGFIPESSQIYLRYDAKRDIVFRAGTKCPKTIVQMSRKYFDDLGRLNPDAYDKFPKFLEKINKSKHQTIYNDDVLDFAAQVRDQNELKKRLNKAYPDGAKSKGLDNLLNCGMYPYQREGALFAARAGRAVIADDMGLGKTIQAIAASQILAKHCGVERVLIVCPTSLKHQWKHEIEKFTSLKPEQTQVIEGSIENRDALYKDTNPFYKIVNYDVIYRDIKSIEDWSPDLVILDEAQRIKNWQTRTARTVKKLSSPYAFVLTGTPLENRLQELYSIVEFVDRFRLGPMFRFLHEHQHVDDNGKVIGYKNLDNISRTLEPILIRRTRDKVLKELPKRLDKKLFVSMTDQQQRHHTENREIVARIVAKWRRYKFLSEVDRRRLMIALQRMRMSCDNSYLLDQQTKSGVKADELADLLSDALEDKNTKVVIFSQWLRMHELLVEKIKSKGWGHVLFHGGVPDTKRKELISEFESNPECRCFLSTDAGGVGLNLQAANMVVNVDQPWNPAVLEQRIARVHRMGQNRPVRVVHLVSQGTIEEGMLSLINFKKSMFSGVLDGGKSEVFMGSSKLKKFMETVETATENITSPMPEDTKENDETSYKEQSQVSTSSSNTTASTSKSAAKTSNASKQTQEAWGEVAAAGLSLIEKLSAAINTSQNDENSGANSRANNTNSKTNNKANEANSLENLIQRDEKTGNCELRVPLPDSTTLNKFADMLKSLSR